MMRESRLTSRKFATGLALICVVGLFYLAITTKGSTLLDLRFNPFAILSATTIALNLSLFIYFIRKPARTDERIWMSVFLLGLILYAFGEMMWRLSATQTGAVFWTNVSDVGPLVPASLYLFTLAYTSRSEKRYPGLAAVLLLGSALIEFIVGFTNIVFSNIPATYTPHAWGLDSSVAPGAGLIFDGLWYFGLPALAWIQLAIFRRHTRNEILRKQSLIFIIGTGVPIVLGLFTDLILPALGVSIPAMAITLFTPGAILFIYGLVRYQLLTISPTLFSSTILAIMQESVIATDVDFNIVFVNHETENLLGLAADSGNKASILDFVTDNYKSEFKKAFETVPTSDHTIDIERVDLARPQGGSVPVRVRSSQLQLSDFRVNVMVLTDITKELQTRGVIEHEVEVRTRQLNQARAYLVSSINSLEQGFILVNRDEAVELSNERAGVYLKQTDTELAGAGIGGAAQKLAWNVDLAKVVRGVMARHKARHQQVSSEDGNFYQVYVTPVLAGDDILGVTIVIEDITEQKILERSKDEFFSIASHELRTPLTAIRGNMSMVRDYYQDSLKDESLAAIVNDTHEASVRLIGIVNDFMDSSRLEQGKMVFNMKPVSIEPLVESVTNDLAAIAEKKQDKFVVEGLDALPMVQADEARLRQIIYNLVNNAIMYSEVATIAISGKKTHGFVELRVSDTGKGISPENQKLLFHKFQQAGSSILTRDNTKGTGLGLYICRLLANNMHGSIELEHSEEGKGSSFLVRMPLSAGKIEK